MSFHSSVIEIGEIIIVNVWRSMETKGANYK